MKKKVLIGVTAGLIAVVTMFLAVIVALGQPYSRLDSDELRNCYWEAEANRGINNYLVEEDTKLWNLRGEVIIRVKKGSIINADSKPDKEKIISYVKVDDLKFYGYVLSSKIKKVGLVGIEESSNFIPNVISNFKITLVAPNKEDYNEIGEFVENNIKHSDDMFCIDLTGDQLINPVLVENISKVKNKNFGVKIPNSYYHYFEDLAKSLDFIWFEEKPNDEGVRNAFYDDEVKIGDKSYPIIRKVE